MKTNVIFEEGLENSTYTKFQNFYSAGNKFGPQRVNKTWSKNTVFMQTDVLPTHPLLSLFIVPYFINSIFLFGLPVHVFEPYKQIYIYADRKSVV